MRRAGWLTPLALAMAGIWPPISAYAAEATATLHVQARMSSRTALSVSTENLHFAIVDASESATASVDFSAAARTHAEADVVLSIEVADAVVSDEDHSSGERYLSFAGEGDGVLRGKVVQSAPSVAARWSGSGRRSGRLVFTLRARAAGDYTIPVRFVLTAP